MIIYYMNSFKITMGVLGLIFFISFFVFLILLASTATPSPINPNESEYNKTYLTLTITLFILSVICQVIAFYK
jgi:hypothetical protein